jgi:ADP-heptose:LPS heptosyltransferase
VVLGTSWETKNWILEGYLELVGRVQSDCRLTVVLVGDRSQKALADQFPPHADHPGLINLVGQTTLIELLAVMKAAAVGIGPDSGPGHLAAAVGTPFVSLFGPTSPQRTAPYGNEGLVVKSAIDCAPCYKRRCLVRNHECMRAITVTAIMAKVSRALNG